MKIVKEIEFHRQPGWDAWIMFLKAYKAVVDRVDGEMRRSADISLAEFEILDLVNTACGRVRFIDLAKLTSLSQSRISRQIDNLQARGYLYREITDSDRRATFAVMTPAGQKVLESAADRFRNIYEKNFVGLLTESDLPVFHDTLFRLLKDPDFWTRTGSVINAARAANGGQPVATRSGGSADAVADQTPPRPARRSRTAG